MIGSFATVKQLNSKRFCDFFYLNYIFIMVSFIMTYGLFSLFIENFVLE